MTAKFLLALLLCLFTAASANAAEPQFPPLRRTFIQTSSFGSAKYGFKDASGKLKIDYIYDYAEEFSEGFALVLKDGRAYFIDRNGLAVFNSKYSVYKYIEGFSESRALIKADGKYGFINTKGQVSVKPVYDDALSFREGKAAVCKNGKYGYIDTNGKVIIDFMYDNAASFSGGIARISKNGKYGFIDESGESITPIIYERTGSFSCGLCPVRINGKYTFINKSGTLLTAPLFDWAADFENGLAIVKCADSFGCIDTNGDMAISPKYSSLSQFCDGYMICGKSTEYSIELFGVTDENEFVYIPFIYEEISYLSDHLYLVKKDGKYGVMTLKNKYLISPVYDSISRDGDIFTAYKGDEQFLFDINSSFDLSDEDSSSSNIHTNLPFVLSEPDLNTAV